jgi:ribosomal protein S27E
MTPVEKVAYLKGLAEGLGLDPKSKEGKLFSVVIDVLGDIATDLEDLEAAVDEIGEDLDDLIEDVDQIEEFVDDLADEDCCCDEDDGCCCHREDDEDEDEEPVFYEVTCPSCENTITIDEDVLLMGGIECPNCGEKLEFDIEEALEDSEEDEGEDE